MGTLYAKDGKIFCNEYMEIYVPLEYFKDNEYAVNKGVTVETLGIVYARSFPNGEEGPIKLMNLPIVVEFSLYEFKYETIKIHDINLEVMTLQYPKDSYVFHQTLEKGRTVAESFLSSILAGKLPKTLYYPDIINKWWRNLDIASVSFKVPSKIFEMIIAAIYRNPRNTKERYGQYYGRQSNPNGYDYKTGNVREVVKDLSTFTGMVFEDISSMISNGINNSINENDEPVSPLEKIIHY